VHGRYQCRSCGRQYPAFAEEARARWTSHGVLQPAVPTILAWHGEGGKQ